MRTDRTTGETETETQRFMERSSNRSARTENHSVLSSASFRTEKDSIGTLEVPADVYYGVQTLRAARNFQITGRRMNPVFLKNLALIKEAAAVVNFEAGTLSRERRDAIVTAAEEVASGKFRDSFIVDPVQGGAGTSANMNMNEVIANRAGELLGDPLGSYTAVHPNDHVNMCQSTNDVIPTAGKMTVIDLVRDLSEAMKELESALYQKALEFMKVRKMGRTQLQDAVPMTLGDTFGGYASMTARCRARLEKTALEMHQINLGGTAIGSGINASGCYEANIAPTLSGIYGGFLEQASDLYDATENLDGFVAVSGALKALVVSLSKMCNDLRLLSSGPRCGLHEINLPAMQNGSSIMPGKVNPVIPEVVTQAAFLVMGNDVTITAAAEAGQMELNAFEPVCFYTLFEGLTAMAGAVRTLTANCIRGITANSEHCLHLEQNSVGIATALCPYLGYAKSAEIAKEALRTGKSVREIALEWKVLSESRLDEILEAGEERDMARTA